MSALITKLVKAEPAEQDGQPGFLMTYDVELPAWVENPQWISQAAMDMLLSVSPPAALAVIEAALATDA